LVNANEDLAILVTVFGITIEVISLLENADGPIDLTELSIVKLPVHPLASLNSPDEVLTEYVPLPQAKVLISALAVLIEPILRLKIRPVMITNLFMEIRVSLGDP
jgi:hypothetical protein